MDAQLTAATYHGHPCPKCGGTKRYVNKSACIPCAVAQATKWNRQNKAKAYAATKRWETSNPDASRATKKRWQARNKTHRRAARAEQRARLLQRTPKWLTEDDRAEMRAIYRLAVRMRRMTGREWHVDHIVPLKGKSVCGLHVPWNLRVIPARLNLQKGNRLLGHLT